MCQSADGIFMGKGKGMKIFFQGLWLSIAVRFFLLREWIVHVLRYLLCHPIYLLADIFLVLSYFFKSPYRIVREWDETHKERVGPYGEIPISEMERMYALLLKNVPIQTMTDVGAGRGRIALWAACTKGWNVQAIECVPTFCLKLKHIVGLFRIRNVDVREVDFAKSDLRSSDFVLINPGELEMSAGTKLLRMLAPLKSGSRILTVGFALSELDSAYQFEGSITLKCPWGEELAVLHQKRD